MTSMSYDVRVWKTEVYRGERVTTHRVMWRVGGRRLKRSFRTAAAADSFRSELITASRRGEGFDEATGLPVSQRRAAPAMPWYDFCCAYVDMKWPTASPKHRKSLAEGLLAVTPALLDRELEPARAKALRSALLNWGFNTRRRGTADQPPEVTELLSWVGRHGRDLDDIARPDVLRRLAALTATRLDGTPAAPRTNQLRRVVLSGALDYAVELGLLVANPMPKIKWTTQRVNTSIDRRSVVNPDQARALLDAVAATPRSGHLLVGLFACMYYAALRPEEAVALRPRNLDLPSGAGWGWLTLDTAAPERDQQWTDTGQRRAGRQLKHRPVGDTRRVPAHPELVAMLHQHIADHGWGRTGVLFHGEAGDSPSSATYRRLWDRARLAALTAEQYAGPLARRPYDLRHAAVSTWLSAGVPPAQVAAWAGHSVDVLLKVYAQCIDGQESVALARIEASLAGPMARNLGTYWERTAVDGPSGPVTPGHDALGP